MMNAARQKCAAVALIAGAAACAAYAFQFRYFLRIVPVPALAASMLFDAEGPAPALEPRGRIDFPSHDLTDPHGLRAALDHIRAMSPLRSDAGAMSYDGMDFTSWLRQLPQRSMYCTDATQLFILMAHQQGLRAREWWLWASAGYADGNAHSLAGFYNPRLGRWQLVDPFTATVLKRPDGSPASMQDLLAGQRLVYERSTRVTAASIPDYDIAGIIDSHTRVSFTPVLNLKPPHWLADTPRSDIVAAYAVASGTSRHSLHVYLTKLALVLAVVSLAVALRLAYRRREPAHRPMVNQILTPAL